MQQMYCKAIRNETNAYQFDVRFIALLTFHQINIYYIALMLKGCFKNIVSFSMALLVLASTMSFTISEHYCGGELVASSLFVKADTCGMEMPMSTSNETRLKTNGCCNDVVQVIEGQDDLKSNFTQLEFKQQVFLTAFCYSYSNLFEENDSSLVPFNHYTPPLIVKDIQVLDAVFLI